MSTAESDRATLIAQVVARTLTQRQAARLLGLSERQVRRLVAAYEARGAVGLVSLKRGQASNRRLADEVRTRALALVHERYPDFGPTLAHEKLTELHELSVSLETLRKWMVADGLWVPRSQRDRRLHQPRLARQEQHNHGLSQVVGVILDGSREHEPRCRHRRQSATPGGRLRPGP